MRNKALNSISILTFATVVTIGLTAKAELDPNMEAAVACSTPECMFRGNSQAHDNLGGTQRITLPGGAHMYNVNRYQDNPDQVVDRASQTQFAPIGELESNRTVSDLTGKTGHEFGTGFLVSPCYIVTNAHVVYGDDLSPVPGKDYSMTFRAGTSATSIFAGNTVATPVISGDRDMTGKNDWTLMKLSNCIGKRPEFGWFEQAQTGQKPSQKVAVVGYAGDRQRGQLSIGIGKVQGIEQKTGMLLVSASAAPGQSGGAVLTVENGSIKLAGLYTAARRDAANKHAIAFATYDAPHANLFQSTKEILNDPTVKMVLDQDKAAFGGQNPAANRLTRPLTGSSQMASN